MLLRRHPLRQVWFDRAMQRVDDLHFNEMMTTLMYFGQVAEVSYLEQQTSGRVAIGAYLYQKSDAMLWYDRMYSLANGTLPVRFGREPTGRSGLIADGAAG